MNANGLKARFVFALHALLVAVCLVVVVNAQVTTPEIRGIVKDEQGALIVGANVTLTREGEPTRETRSDTQGRFGFNELQPGAYAIKIEAKGFGPYEQSLNPQSTKSEPVAITLYPTVKETVTVDTDAAQSAMDPERAAGTIILKERDIAALPDDPDELYSQLQMLATASGSAPGGATVTVDGFIVHG